MPKMKWGLSGDPGEIEAREVYDGPVPPKGVYICRLERLSVKENKNGDPMFNGLLVIADPRRSKKQFNGYSFWFNRNVNEQSARFVKNFVTGGLGVAMKDLKALDNLVILDDKDLPSAVVAIGKVKIEKHPLMVVVVKRRRQNDDPDGDWELQTDDFAPAFPGMDPAKLIAKDKEGKDDDDEDEDEEDTEDEETVDDPFADDDEDDDGDDDEEDEEDDDEEEDEEDDEEDVLTEAELKAMGLEELRELAQEEPHNLSKAKAGKMKKTALVALLKPADEDDEEDDDEEPEPEPEPAPVKAKKRKASKK